MSARFEATVSKFIENVRKSGGVAPDVDAVRAAVRDYSPRDHLGWCQSSARLFKFPHVNGAAAVNVAFLEAARGGSFCVKLRRYI